jgi:DnaJ domain
MMDYYEELGVEPSTSTVEIRQAYRRLMQLLHPDHCTDEATRRLAELQARRLNAVLAVLTDPVERARYDRDLSFERTAGALAPSSQIQAAGTPDWLWPVAGAVAILALISLIPRAQQPAPAGGTSPPPVGIAPAPKKPALSTARPLPHTAPKPLLLPEASTAALAETKNSLSMAPQTVPDQPVLDEPDRPWEPPPLSEPDSDAPPHPRSSPLAGEWLFLPQPSIRSDGLYPPEYIELRVTQQAESLFGKYRARYLINDRAISPNVVFEFQGRAGEKDARLPWTGPGGSRGEIALHLLTTNALEVTWTASHPGDELGLISGTATLIRKVD